MEFSYNYCNTMGRFSCPDNIIYNLAGANIQKVTECPVEMRFKIDKDGGDIPIMAYNNALRIMSTDRETPLEENQFVTMVVPLILGMQNRVCSGADTIMKAFTQKLGRLTKVTTPKGECYYGGNGIVFDKDFHPLIYITRTLNLRDNRHPETTVHLSPKVFTDDTGSLNKALLKKGIAYFLTHEVGAWGNTSIPKIEIDDGAALFFKPNKPIPGVDINKDINNFLKREIGDVLGQLKYDGKMF